MFAHKSFLKIGSLDDSSIMALFFQLPSPDANINAKLLLDGNKYEIEVFRISFVQPTDHKGQPQSEVRGGQLLITLTQSVEENIYEWAVRSGMPIV